MQGTRAATRRWQSLPMLLGCGNKVNVCTGKQSQSSLASPIRGNPVAEKDNVESTVDVAAAAVVGVEMSFSVVIVEAIMSRIASDTFDKSNATVNDAELAGTEERPMRRVRRHRAKWARRSR